MTTPSESTLEAPVRQVVNLGAVIGEAEKELNSIEAAVARLDVTTYGTCTICGLDIPEEELTKNLANWACTEHSEDEMAENL